MPGFKEAPQFGEHIPENDEPYKVVKINYVKPEKKDKKEEEKENKRMPKPLLEK